ncbi:MAG: hypothetical protein IJ371_02050, partial [Clostridia bacterium]|nr:hypothetical protein [Clostridia bacterium]
MSQKVEAKPLTYTYAPNEVVVQKGGSTLNFSYSPSVDAQDSATTVAYEYIFQNPMSDETAAINLKSIDTTGVNVSYVYSDSELDTNNVITGETQYRLQTLENENDRIYIYVLVAPTDTSIPATFTTNVKWYVGKLKEITI